jgi:hypothetical protein
VRGSFEVVEIPASLEAFDARFAPAEVTV